MRERVTAMVMDFEDFAYRYPAAARDIAKATPPEMTLLAKRHDFLLDSRGAPYALERALDLQYGAWVKAAK